jgi:hypothetical protein
MPYTDQEKQELNDKMQKEKERIQKEIDTKWSKEDLNVTTFNDGTPIPVVEDNKEWKNLKTPAMCYYDNDKSKTVLYNWYAVKTGKLAPKGWHVATDEEWKDIKTKDQINLLPGGCRSSGGTFYNIGSGGGWWSATAYDATGAWYSDVRYGIADVYRDYNNYTNGFSVRCVRD